MTDDLDGMSVFLAVAEAKGFRAAGERLGVSASAVSQALRRLEERLGVVLMQRTTRSVRLTPAGERLHSAVRPALDEVRTAVAALGEMASEPRGTLRLHASSSVDAALAAPFLAGFLGAHPHVDVDLAVSGATVDIVAEGYDAGIQLGEVIDRDMIAVSLTGDVRLAVVGAPSYFARRRPPKHPRDLVEHECINWHATPEARPYRWEFTDGGRDFSVAVRARLLSNDPATLVRLARAGVGLTIVYEMQVRDDLARGELIAVLEEFSTPFPGFYLYYPQRRHASPALRALVEHLRRERRRPQTRSKQGRAKR
ncbi:MAG: LysR family transcriptional regulator [Gemmatimonadaceae bacterium]